jgi:hypothetical protein
MFTSLQAEILLGIGLEQSKTGHLPEGLVQKLLSTVKDFKERAEAVGAQV